MKKIVNKRPVVFTAFAFIIGIALAYYLQWDAAALLPCMVAGAAAFAVFFLLGRTWSLFLLYAASFLLGAFLFAVQFPTDFTEIDPTVEYTVEGKVRDRQFDDYNNFTLTDVSLTDETGSSADFEKDIIIYTKEVLDYGDVVQYFGKVEEPSTPRNPGTFDSRMYLASKRAGFSSFVYEVSIVGHEPAWYYFPLRLREAIAEKIDTFFTPETAAVAKAMFLGIKNDIPDEMRDAFSKTGISHVLAISGLHVTIISAAFNWLLKRLKLARGARFSINIAVLVFYALLTGFAPSVLRAVIMTVFLIIGSWKFTKRDMLTFLSLAMLLTLAFNTAQLFTPGFLMSYGVFFGLICLGPAINRFFAKIKFENSFSALLSASLAASIAVFPLTAYFYGGVSLIAPLANFFAVPLTMVIVVMTGAFAVASMIPPLAAVLALIPQLAVSLLNFLNSILANWEVGFVKIEGFSIWMGIAVFALVFLLSDFAMVKKKLKIILSAAIVLVVAAGMIVTHHTANDYLAKITILDVGTGDAIHIATQDGDYLIDNGGNLQYSNMTAYTEDNEITYDAVIISNDRTKNLEDIVTGGFAAALWAPGNYEPKEYDDEIPVRHYGIYDKMQLGDNVWLEAVATDGKTYSFIVNCDGAVVCFLSQNDAETLAGHITSPAVVFKAGKSGADAAVTEDILAALAPGYAVVSVKADNSQGLPDSGTMALLDDACDQVFVTAETGAVIITVKHDGAVHVETMK